MLFLKKNQRCSRDLQKSKKSKKDSSRMDSGRYDRTTREREIIDADKRGFSVQRRGTIDPVIKAGSENIAGKTPRPTNCLIRVSIYLRRI